MQYNLLRSIVSGSFYVSISVSLCYPTSQLSTTCSPTNPPGRPTNALPGGPVFMASISLLPPLTAATPRLTVLRRNSAAPYNPCPPSCSYSNAAKLLVRSPAHYACSTAPFIGRVGLQWREGNSSLLSFGIKVKPSGTTEGSKSDASQALSAMLPFVVAATAVAALAQPATFAW